jgi:hypothetical protein
MSMDLSVYIGPYLEVDRAFDFYADGFDSLLADGRMEAAEEGEPLRLIPGCEVPGIERQTEWDRYSDMPVLAIGSLQVEDEKAAFGRLISPVLTHCNQRKIPVKLCWGVVPCCG